MANVLLSMEMLLPLSSFPNCCWRASSGPWGAGVVTGNFGCSTPEPGAGPGVPLFRGPCVPSMSSCEFLAPWSPSLLLGVIPCACTSLILTSVPQSLQLHPLILAVNPCSLQPFPAPQLPVHTPGSDSAWTLQLFPRNVQTPICV